MFYLVVIFKIINQYNGKYTAKFTELYFLTDVIY